MTDHHEEDELAPTQTAGYKVGEKKSLQEYENLDANDESLKKWKASLGLGKSAGKLLTPLTSLPQFFFTIHSATVLLQRQCIHSTSICL